MTDQEIEAAVQTILGAIPKDVPPTASEAAAVAAGASLLTNLLQNINAIAQGKKQ
jgi:hypothetical protein